MGKGGTRFVGEAIGARSKAKGYTSKERKSDMAAFLETGVHPEVQRVRAVHAAGRAPPLPPPRASRPHLALFLAIAGRDAGRIVVEIFEDVAPAAAALLRDRCAPGAAGCFAGAAVARLLPGLAAFVGGGAAPRGASAPGVQLRRAPELRHGERGAVSLRLDGGELCLLLAPAPHLDATHQVVGRVAAGMEVLDKVDAVGAARDDQPCQRVVVRRCVPCDARGEPLEGGGGEEEAAPSGAALAERVQREAAEAREAVTEALQAGLKRKPEAAAAAGAAPQRAKRGALDAALLGDSDGGGDDSSESSDA